MPETVSPAEKASQKALDEMFECIASNQSFRLEAGAGAGKTYSLEKALDYLIETKQQDYIIGNRQVACITYTNVARDEIRDRVDRNPIIKCETIHAFCWSLISGFQNQMKLLVVELPHWSEKVEEAGGVGTRRIDYNLGHRFINDDIVSLHHDDVIPLTVSLMDNPKFRMLLTSQYPVILIDEYQDTDLHWINSIQKHFLGKEGAPLFGFFGDHWQKIYGDGCGELVHENVTTIGKEANFRSTQTIIEALNKIRPELPQYAHDPESEGEITVYHTNSWEGERRTGAGGGHWKDDLPESEARDAFEATKQKLIDSGWDFAPETTKILMLTHKGLAAEQGYTELASVFTFTESYLKLEHPHIEYFVNVIEPACEAFEGKRYGELFAALDTKFPILTNPKSKAAWQEAMQGLVSLRSDATVAEVVDYIKNCGKPYLPDKVKALENDLVAFDPESGEEKPRKISELEKLHAIPYREIIAFKKYVNGYSPFQTKHGVKGEEYENVLVILGRGWNRYNFGEMLDFVHSGSIPQNKQDAFERNRNLFYVCCSRAKTRLSLLFTQELTDGSLETLRQWFGEQSVHSLEF